MNSIECTNTKYNLSICSNGERCITELMSCNGQNDCGDWSDELHCNSTFIPPKPNGGGGGSSGGMFFFLKRICLFVFSSLVGFGFKKINLLRYLFYLFSKISKHFFST